MPGSQVALDIFKCAGSPHWVVGYLAGCCLAWDCLLSPCGLIWKGVQLPERQKLEVSTPIGCSIGSGEGLWVPGLSAGDDALFLVEVALDGPDSRGLPRLEAASISLFSSQNLIFFRT